MRNVGVALLSSLFLATSACQRASGAPGLSQQGFIFSTIQNARADAEISVMATRRGESPETRQLGALMHRLQGEIADGLTSIAQRRKIPLPAAMAERKVALKDNLGILQGELFDRAYVLAMVQDLNGMLVSLRAARGSNDEELRQFARKYEPIVAEQQRVANRLLNRLGGSPFGMPP
jgi:predicted outer membrane protein